MPMRFRDRKSCGLIEIGLVTIFWYLFIFVLQLFFTGSAAAIFGPLITIIIQIITIPVGLSWIFWIFFGSHLLHKDSFQKLGFRTDNIKKSSKDVLLKATLGFIPGVLLVSFLLAIIGLTFFQPPVSLGLLGVNFNGFTRIVLTLLGLPPIDNWFVDFISQFSYYIVWGFLQQCLFLSFISVRLKEIVGPEKKHARLIVTLTTGLIFGLYHLGNVILVLFTCISGILWSWYYYEEPNMLTVSISHGFGGTMAGIFIFTGFNVWFTMFTGWPM